MSDEDDEMWDDEDEPAESNKPYDAVLQDIKDPSVSYGAQVIEASTDDEAKSKAREWARAECKTQKISKKILLIVRGGTIYGSYSEVIDPAGL